MGKTITQNPVKPYGKNPSKTAEVEKMFDNIADKYDFLNHFFSLGINNLWAKKAIQYLKKTRAKKVLDIACGSGDMALKIKKNIPHCEVIGVDISQKMLDIASIKSQKNRFQNIEFIKMNGESLKFSDKKFDAITIAYGIRNYNDPLLGLKEAHRVLKNNGFLLILELTEPTNKLLRWFYKLYFTTFVPVMGKIISKDHAAYGYLPRSVEAFPAGKNFLNLMTDAGFRGVQFHPLTYGICTLYIGKKLI